VRAMRSKVVPLSKIIHVASQLTGDGLIHAWGCPVIDNTWWGPWWVPLCGPTLFHGKLPGEVRQLGDVTCIKCMVELLHWSGGAEFVVANMVARP
jgi:hypothetical protein